MSRKRKLPYNWKTVCSNTKLWSLRRIKDCNELAGYYFFSPGAMRFFRSRVSDYIHQGKCGVYFVTSEQFQDSHGRRDKRLYTVHRYKPRNGTIDTVGEFQQYKTSESAHKSAEAFAKCKRKP